MSVEPLKRAELIGYADRLTALPGDSVQFKVSCEMPAFEVQMVRLVRGGEFEEEADQQLKMENVSSNCDGVYPGSQQSTYPGSFVLVDPDERIEGLRSVSVQAWVQPTAPSQGREQGIISLWEGNRGFSLLLDGNGALTLMIGDGQTSRELGTGVPLRKGQWYFVVGTYDGESDRAHVESSLVKPWPVSDRHVAVSETLGEAVIDGSGLRLRLGAMSGVTGGPIWAAVGCFNGRIDSPRLYSKSLDQTDIDQLRTGANSHDDGTGLIARWAFGENPSSPDVVNAVADGLSGIVYNHATQAVAGWRWDGTALNPEADLSHYAAIHFHDDDLEDARWETSFTWDVPKDLRSGVYAAYLSAEGTSDFTPVFVRPAPWQSKSSVAFLMPTNTYLAYANESNLSRQDTDFSRLTNIPIEPDPYHHYLMEHPELFGSIYDVHTDGSGIDYSTYLRPIVNLRPTYRDWVSSTLRHFSLDLCLIDWLETKEVAYDIITDQALDELGTSLLTDYSVVITGSHPEYWTGGALDALQSYLDAGGRLMYLGGNGFYWVTAVNPEQNHIIEVRRGYSGNRCWESHPGEIHLASTGEQGGLWRHRGRYPNSMVGIGFAAQGWDTKCPGYCRLPQSFDESVSFIFEGIESDEVIGDFGLVMGGAAGEEIDRYDEAKGSPPHAMRLATSAEKYSRFYLLVHEDNLVSMQGNDGPNSDLVRSDMVYMRTDSGGAVFSVGSMTWLGSLVHADYDNNVSRVTENVLRGFLAMDASPT